MRGLLVVVLLALTCGCERPAPAEPKFVTTPCRLPSVMEPARCGAYEVFEDRRAAAGRKIPLNIAIVPAWGGTTLPDPMFVLAGGPGQSAVRDAAPIAMALHRVNEHRDIVLVDQRGTGKSNPLTCDEPDGSLKDLLSPPKVEDAAKCLAELDADTRLYTTDVAMDDLNEVRQALGYEKINLWGGSYGSRAALIYSRRHPESTRRVVLDGAAPTDVKLVAHAGRDGQRALDMMFERCAATPECNAAFPDLAARFQTWIQLLAEQPQVVQVHHPRTGALEEVEMSRDNVASMVRSVLYAPEMTAVLPFALDRAIAGDFEPLVAEFGLLADGVAGLSAGMYMSVVCAEDEPRITSEERATLTDNFFGPMPLQHQAEACAVWPAAKMPEAYFEPVTAKAPTLILSGTNDPVLPPSWGDLTASRLPNALHIVVEGAGHGLTALPCIAKTIDAFYDAEAPLEVEAKCTDMSVPFVLDTSGRTR